MLHMIKAEVRYNQLNDIVKDEGIKILSYYLNNFSIKYRYYRRPNKLYTFHMFNIKE